jgi:hypothetical protein
MIRFTLLHLIVCSFFFLVSIKTSSFPLFFQKKKSTPSLKQRPSSPVATAAASAAPGAAAAGQPYPQHQHGYPSPATQSFWQQPQPQRRKAVPKALEGDGEKRLTGKSGLGRTV